MKRFVLIFLCGIVLTGCRSLAFNNKNEEGNAEGNKKSTEAKGPSMMDYFYPQNSSYEFFAPSFGIKSIVRIYSENGTCFMTRQVAIGMQNSRTEEIIISSDKIISIKGKDAVLSGYSRTPENNIILMLPKFNNLASWQYKEVRTDGKINLIERTAKFVKLNIKINGHPKKLSAIEVSEAGVPIQYWAKGYGLVIDKGGIYFRSGFSSNYAID